MTKVEFSRSHAAIWFYAGIGIAMYAFSFLASSEAMTMPSQDFFVALSRYVIPFVAAVFVAYEAYLSMIVKPKVVLDSHGIHDEISRKGTFPWSDIMRLHFLSNMGIYQLHIYLKNQSKPVRVAPFKAKGDEIEKLKKVLGIEVLRT